MMQPSENFAEACVSEREKEFWAVCGSIGWSTANLIFDGKTVDAEDYLETRVSRASVPGSENFGFLRATAQQILKTMWIARELGIGTENAFVLLANCIEFRTQFDLPVSIRNFYYWLSERNQCSGFIG